MSDQVNIDVRSPEAVVIDVSNKIAAVASGDIISSLGYTPEDKSNITCTWNSTSSDSRYPSEKLVKDSIDSINTSIGSEGWTNHVTESNLKSGDILIHNGTKFINRPKEDLTDGGNF